MSAVHTGNTQARTSRPQLRVGVVALAAAALLGAGCSNKIVTTAQPIADVTTTTAVAVSINPLPVTSLAQVLALVVAANPPSAAEIASAPINVLRTKTLSAITARLNALNAATSSLSTVSSAHLGAAGLAAERSEIATAVSGLTALQAQVTAEQSPASLRTQAKQMVNYLNVSTVIVPKVGLLVAADGLLRTTDSLAPQIAALQIQITNDLGRGKAVGPAQAALAGVQTADGQTVSVAGGLMNSVPSVTSAAQVAADQGILASGKNTVTAAQNGMATVRADLSAVAG